MSNEVKVIPFRNKQNPNARFDLLQIQTLFSRAVLDHNPEEHHRVNFFLLLIITEGQGSHMIDLQEYECSRGTILTIRKDQIHRFTKSSYDGYMLLFTDEFLIQYLDKQENLKSLQLFNELLGSPKVHLDEADLLPILALIHRMKEEYLEVKDDYSLEILRSELHILVTKLYRSKSQKGAIIHQRKYLEEFLIFQELVEQQCFSTKKVKNYAGQMAISTKTLNNIVQSVVQKSAKTFIDEICVTQIKRLLINSSLTIKEIAYEAGFDEPSNLFKYFKRYESISPEQFRNKHR